MKNNEGGNTSNESPESAQPGAQPAKEEPDGWIGVALIKGEPTSVAFRDEKTAREMCVEGDPLPFWLGGKNATTA